MKFFTHEINSRTDDRLFELMDIHGLNGYGFFWVILEELYGSEETGFQIEATNIWMKRLARSLNLTDDRTIIRYFDTLADLGLINKQLWHERIIYSQGVMQRADPYMERKAKEAEKKRNQRTKAQSSVTCPEGVPRESLGTKSMSQDVPLPYTDPDPNSDPHSQADPDPKTEENTRSEDIYISPIENFPEPIQPIEEILIADMAEEEETPIPPTPLASLPPENIGLAIASDSPKSKKSKNTLESDRITFKPFLDVWLQDKVEDWVKHEKLSPTAISKLKTLHKEYGNALEIFQKGLLFAQSDSYHKRVPKGWSIEQYLGTGKPYQYYEKYEQAPKRISACGESIMSNDEIKKARIYAQLEQAMAVAS